MTARIDAITLADVKAAGRAMLKGAPTVAAIGKIGRVLDGAHVARRLGSRSA